jgi:hypothetical protein
LCLPQKARCGAAYNHPMPARFVLPALLAACSALAQVPAQNSPQPAPEARDVLSIPEQPGLNGKRNQKIERIHLEDAGSVIDEVRYGGQTQSITVQPKAGVPRYEVQPVTGQRFWNVLRF